MDGNIQLIADLQAGKTVQFRPRGNSMTPRIKSGQLVTIEPVEIQDLVKGDICYCKVNGNIYVHLVTAVGQDGRVQISNNKGRINGWTSTVYGILTKVEK